MTPPPVKSPSPDHPPETEEKTDPGRPVSMAEMRRSALVTRIVFGLLAAFVSSGAGIGGVVGALSLVRTEARAQAKLETDRIDAGVKGLEARTTTLEQQVPQLRAEVYQQRVEVWEQRKDMRALQDVILYNRPSKRLTEPLPPPPAPTTLGDAGR